MQSQRETLLCHYVYDALDQLIGHRLTDSPTIQRFYCKSSLATETQGAIKHSIVQHGDLLLAQHKRQDDAVDTTLLATDLQRSVLHTLKANYPRQPIAYSPYGHRRADSGLTSLLGFSGERPDPVTGHYLLGNGYRAFNPVLMRFNSPDSWSPFGKGGLNSYAYCVGDPANKRDPTGHIGVRRRIAALNAANNRTLNPVTPTTVRARNTPSRAPSTEAVTRPIGTSSPAQPNGASPIAHPPAYSLTDPFPFSPGNIEPPPSYYENASLVQQQPHQSLQQRIQEMSAIIDRSNRIRSERAAQIRERLDRIALILSTHDEEMARADEAMRRIRLSSDSDSE
jgi:RHS repeat-associated protein